VCCVITGTPPWQATYWQATHCCLVWRQPMAQDGAFLSTILLQKPKRTFCGSFLDPLEQCRMSRWSETSRLINAKDLGLWPWLTTKKPWLPFSPWMVIPLETGSFRSPSRPTTEKFNPKTNPKMMGSKINEINDPLFTPQFLFSSKLISKFKVIFSRNKFLDFLL